MANNGLHWDFAAGAFTIGAVAWTWANFTQQKWLWVLSGVLAVLGGVVYFVKKWM